MSFAFDFGGNDFEVDDAIVDSRSDKGAAEVGGQGDGVQTASKASQTARSAADAAESRGKRTDVPPARRHTLDDLIETLPTRISYSSLDIPTDDTTTAGATLRLYRRDLFDARFQLIQDEDDHGDNLSDSMNEAAVTGADEAATLRSNDGNDWARLTAESASDLLPGLYEGGFKTWECALDLVGVLARRTHQDRPRESSERGPWHNKRVLELGCGTAVPSMYLLCSALTDSSVEDGVKDGRIGLSLDLCDFNEQVLRLVTLPNILLTWYFYANQKVQKSRSATASSGELELSPELLEAFRADLSEKDISITFFSGPWQGLAQAGAFPPEDSKDKSRHDLILTSETIYSVDSLPILIDTLEAAACAPLESGLANVSLSASAQQRTRSPPPPPLHSQSDTAPLTLVAAKVLYFGVGGSVLAFEQEVAKRRRARTKTVWKSERGVSRVVLQVQWAS